MPGGNGETKPYHGSVAPCETSRPTAGSAIPTRTPEPFGDERGAAAAPAAGAPRRFVVQQHAARRLHCDLRLEIDGRAGELGRARRARASIAKEKRLAVRTEDHPLEYADFEGVIPAGQLRRRRDDRVGPRHLPDASTGSTPAEGLEAGKLDLELARPQAARPLRARAHEARRRQRVAAAAEGRARREPGVEPVRDAAGVGALGPHRRGARARARRATRRVEAALARARGAGARARPRRRSGRCSRDRRRAVLARRLALRAQVRRRARARGEGRGRRGAARRARGRDARRSSTRRSRAPSRASRSRASCSTARSSRSTRAAASSFERIQRRFTQRDPREIARAARRGAGRLLRLRSARRARPRPARAPARARARSSSRASRRALGVVRFADHVESDGARALRGGAPSTSSRAWSRSARDSTYESGRRSPRWLKLKVPRTRVLAIVGWTAGRRARARARRAAPRRARATASWCTRASVGSGLDETTIDSAAAARSRPRALAEPPCTGVPDAAARAARASSEPALVCERALHRGDERRAAAPAGLPRARADEREPSRTRRAPGAPRRGARARARRRAPRAPRAPAPEPELAAHAPRQGVLAGRGLHQGRSARLLRGGLAVARAVPARPAASC